ncbi:MAG: ricin-type beta-trefoil lectin domain protein [Rhodoblastus sp.]
MRRLGRVGVLVLLSWAAFSSNASAQAPAGTYTCTFYGARYVGTGWNQNGRTFAHTHADMGVAQQTARKQCQDDYLREGRDPTLILNACIYGPCDFKPASQQQGQGQGSGQGSGQGQGQTSPGQFPPQVQQLCNAYADSVVRHYTLAKQNGGCASGLLFPPDRGKYYSDCAFGVAFQKKKFDPQAGDYRKVVDAACKPKPQFQQNVKPFQSDPRAKFCHDYADFAKKASQDWGKRKCAGGPPTHDRWYDHQSWCKSQSDATVQQAMAGIRAKSATCNAGPAPGSGGARSFAVAANPRLCMDVEKGRAVAGNRVQLWHCTGKAPQKFILEPGAGRIRFAGSNLCVEQIPGGRMLELTPCNQTSNRWTYDPGSQRFVFNGVCLDVPGGRFNPLQQLGVWPCHNGPPQKFIMR